MKFISPSFEIIPIPEQTNERDVLKHLEKIGRVCYKSEEKITDDSCIKFLENIKKRKHWAMLEHYVFVMEVSDSVYSSIYDDMSLFDDVDNINQKFKYINISTHESSTGEAINIVSGSATAFNYIWEHFNGILEDDGIIKICHFLYSHYPEIMKRPDNEFIPSTFKGDKHHVHSKVDEVKFFNIKEIDNLNLSRNDVMNIRSIHQTITVKFITDRGVSHELVRHRPASWAQESTRYCNYGSDGCTFIIPGWINQLEHNILELMDKDDVVGLIDLKHSCDLDANTREWITAMYMAENAYNTMLKNGWVPQQARSVLPNSIKTEIIMTANLYEWYHFFDMRADRAAHPQMQELSYPLLKMVNELVPDFFMPLVKRAMEQGVIN